MDLYVFNSAGDRIELDKINNDQQGKRQLIYVCDTDKQEEVDELVSILITGADNIGLETNPVDLIGVYSLSHKEDRLYTLCQRYMSVWEAGDGYWLTVTELDMYEEIKRRHVELGILKKD